MCSSALRQTELKSETQVIDFLHSNTCKLSINEQTTKIRLVVGFLYYLMKTELKIRNAKPPASLLSFHILKLG